METIVVNGKTYYSEKQSEINGDLKIVVLQRGWVLIGRFEKDGDFCKLHDSYTIRKWGTTDGLGQLAKFGKQEDTILDKNNGLVEFHILTVVLMIACDEKEWY
jgi:hypothetical protein